MPHIQITDNTYRLLTWLAVATALLVVGTMVYQYLYVDPPEGQLDYRRANLRLEDGEYAAALAAFDQVLAGAPQSAPSHLGRALALMGLQRHDEALDAFATALALTPDFAAAYANRGILHDRLGRYDDALADYRQALRLDPELADGPDWLTRFFRNQYDAPPTIADRARYLEAELAKPPGERLLRLPEVDAAQRSYKVGG